MRTICHNGMLPTRWTLFSCTAEQQICIRKKSSLVNILDSPLICSSIRFTRYRKHNQVPRYKSRDKIRNKTNENKPQIRFQRGHINAILRSKAHCPICFARSSVSVGVIFFLFSPFRVLVRAKRFLQKVWQKMINTICRNRIWWTSKQF
jgi:hypothetical protein